MIESKPGYKKCYGGLKIFLPSGAILSYPPNFKHFRIKKNHKEDNFDPSVQILVSQPFGDNQLIDNKSFDQSFDQSNDELPCPQNQPYFEQQFFNSTDIEINSGDYFKPELSTINDNDVF